MSKLIKTHGAGILDKGHECFLDLLKQVKVMLVKISSKSSSKKSKDQATTTREPSNRFQDLSDSVSPVDETMELELDKNEVNLVGAKGELVLRDPDSCPYFTFERDEGLCKTYTLSIRFVSGN